MHEGHSADSGHYVSIVRYRQPAQQADVWLHCNDANVCMVSEATALRTVRAAQLLLYERTQLPAA